MISTDQDGTSGIPIRDLLTSSTSHQVSANPVGFALHTLGWKAFQDLCLTVASEVLGQTVEGFLSSNDAGRDGAFRGTWQPRGSEAMSGEFVIQCKFSSNAATGLTLSKVHEDLLKAARLARRGRCQVYVLLTNCTVSGRSADAIRRAFEGIPGLDHCLVLGADWLAAKIRESPRLRMLVPRVYGLGDLSQIVDERKYEQASAILASIGDDLARFVITSAFRKSATALMNHGFVMLIGEPASGKSTIAAVLALGALDLWGTGVLKIDSPAEVARHWNPNEPLQLFWIDDAFGVTQYQRDASDAWNRTIPLIHAAAKTGARFVLTSRDYIYRAAKVDLKMHAWPLLEEAKVVIEVQETTLPERKQMLYNHLKLGRQPREFRRRIKGYLDDVAGAGSFLPEMARRLGDPMFTRGLRLDGDGITDFVAKPMAFLVDVVRSLDNDSKAALAAVFMAGGLLPSPVRFTREVAHAVDLMGSNQASVRQALPQLAGSLVSLIERRAENSWTFRHPTIADAFGATVAENPELLDIYLQGSKVEALIREVTCGDVGLQGVKVVVPPSRFDAFLSRLLREATRKQLLGFLSRRSDRAFMGAALSRIPNTPDVSRIISYVGISDEVDLIVRMSEVGLLDDDVRAAFLDRLAALAIETPDTDFLDVDRIRGMLKEEELRSLRNLVREELAPVLESRVEEWESDWDGRGDPDEYFEPLRGVISTLKDEFDEDKEVLLTLDAASSYLDGTVSSLAEKLAHEDYGYDDYEPSGGTVGPSFDSRSMFDDLDE